MGLNLCVGYTGLVSFGHGTWFGIGAYAAGLIQLHWFGGEIWLPLLSSMAVVAVLSAVAGIVILRRRGVYFSLLTLALAALTYTTAFRWSEVTGGEDGLGGLKRGSIGALHLDNALAYYVTVALIGLAVLYRAAAAVAFAVRPRAGGDPREPVARRPSRAIRSNATSLRSRDLGSGDGLAGALIAFQNYLVSAEAVSVPFSGELLAMVVIGGMRSMLGPALGALFFILFRELFSIWTPNWLLWFGLIFVAFVMYSPGRPGRDLAHAVARRWSARRRKSPPP